MQGLRESSQSPDGNRAPLEEIETWSTGNEHPGLNEWSGRFWLPDGGQVEPARKYCMICGDGRAGEMTLVRFDHWGLARHDGVFKVQSPSHTDTEEPAIHRTA